MNWYECSSCGQEIKCTEEISWNGCPNCYEELEAINKDGEK